MVGRQAGGCEVIERKSIYYAALYSPAWVGVNPPQLFGVAMAFCAPYMAPCVRILGTCPKETLVRRSREVRKQEHLPN